MATGIKDRLLEAAAIGGEDVMLYETETHLKHLRACDKITLADVAVAEFSFKELTHGGGKGGQKMKKTRSGKLIIKELSEDDHRSLFEVVPSFVKHLTDASAPSLITRIYFHFLRPADGQAYIVLQNIIPREVFDNADLEGDLYDLKGCCDDKMMIQGAAKVPQVHKRWFMTHWLVAEGLGAQQCVSAARTQYKKLKERSLKQVFVLDARDCAAVKDIVTRDAQFFGKAGLMDYSLLVGVLRQTAPPARAWPTGGGLVSKKPLLSYSEDGKTVEAIYIGIIDFLQAWNTGKKVAHVIKEIFAPHPISTIEPEAYSRQFIEANNKRFVPRAAARGGAERPAEGSLNMSLNMSRAPTLYASAQTHTHTHYAPAPSFALIPPPAQLTPTAPHFFQPLPPYLHPASTGVSRAASEGSRARDRDSVYATSARSSSPAFSLIHLPPAHLPLHQPLPLQQLQQLQPQFAQHPPMQMPYSLPSAGVGQALGHAGSSSLWRAPLDAAVPLKQPYGV